jgi:hypothetical protein
MKDRAIRARYISVILPVDERPQQLFEYGVTGSGKFPFEMLSLDAAWPLSEQDAASMALDQQNDRCIRLRSYREPTIKRWTSLAWDVRGRTRSVPPSIPTNDLLKPVRAPSKK